MFSVVTNNNALAALQALNNTQKSMTATQSRITTGMKVASAADNASTFAIAQGMRGDIAGLKAVNESIALGKSTVGVALSAAEQISNKLNDLKGKVAQGQGQNVDLAKIQQDINSIVQSIDDISSSAQFNGVNLIDSTPSNLTVLTGLNRTSATAETATSTTITAQNLSKTGLGIGGIDVATTSSASFSFGSAFSITATAGGGDQISLVSGGVTHVFEFTDGSATAIKASTTTTQQAHAVVVDTTNDTPQEMLDKAFTVMRDAGFSVTANEDGSFQVSKGGGVTAASFEDTSGTAKTTVTSSVSSSAAAASLVSVENAINTAKAAVASLGTQSNQLDAYSSFTSSLVDSLTTGVGQLVDADMAEESANLQALQTRQQLGIQALSIANSQPGSILSLFRG